MFPKRHYNKWRPNELENLYREYNLRELTVQEIAELHGRSVFSILNKLVHENLVDEKWSNARGIDILIDKKADLEDDLEEDDESEDDSSEYKPEEDDLEDDDSSEYKPEEDDESEDDDSSEYKPEEDDLEDDDSSEYKPEEDDESEDDKSEENNSELYNLEVKNITTIFTLKWISIGLAALRQFYEKNIIPLFRK